MTPATHRRSLGVLTVGLAVVLITAASGCSSNPSMGASPAPLGGAKPSAPAQVASLAQVLQLVAAAAHITTLPADLRPTLRGALADNNFALLGSRKCLPVFATTQVPISNCVFGDPSGLHTLVIIGDSHAAMWLPPLDAVGQRLHWRVIDLNKVSCPAADVSVFLKQESRAYTECDAWHTWAIAQINAVRPSILMLVSETGYRILKGGTYEQGLERTLNGVTSRGTRKVILGQIPYLGTDGTQCLAAHQTSVQSCSYATAASTNTEGQRGEQQAASKSGAAYVNVIPWFCSSVCTAVVGNMVVNSNQQHITQTYALFLSGAMQAAIQPQLAAVR